MMDRVLNVLFDYQRFANNGQLAAVIGETTSGYRVPLSDDDLELVNAAGEIPAPDRPDAATEAFPHV